MQSGVIRAQSPKGARDTRSTTISPTFTNRETSTSTTSTAGTDRDSFRRLSPMRVNSTSLDKEGVGHASPLRGISNYHQQNSHHNLPPLSPIQIGSINNQTVPQSRRWSSLDSSGYGRRFNSPRRRGGDVDDSEGRRSLSAGETPVRVMNRLSFENIDLLNTPLSSLRSCSEYNRYNPDGTPSEVTEDEPKEKSFFMSLFSWGVKKVKNKVRFRDSKEDQIYMIESMRFNEANLLEGEDYNYREDSGDSGSSEGSGGNVSKNHNNSNNKRSNSTGSSSDRSRMLSTSISKAKRQQLLKESDRKNNSGIRTTGTSSQHNNDTSNSNRRSSNDSTSRSSSTQQASSSTTTTTSSAEDRRQQQQQQRRRRRRRNGRDNHNLERRQQQRSSSTFMRESSKAWDFVFGYGPRNKNLPMEIELKDLKEPQLLSVYPYSHHISAEEHLLLQQRMSENSGGGGGGGGGLNGGGSSSGSLSLHQQHLLQEEALDLLGIRRVTSLGSIQRLRTESIDSTHTAGTHSSLNSLHTPHSSGGLGSAGGSGLLSSGAYGSSGHSLSSMGITGNLGNNNGLGFSPYHPSTWWYLLRETIAIRNDQFRTFYARHLRNANGDELLYESIRIQPFSAGSYLRGLLSAGFCGTAFNIYNLMSWPDLTNSAAAAMQQQMGHSSGSAGVSGVAAATASAVVMMPLGTTSRVLEYVLFAMVCLQLVLHLAQLPSRLRINSLCWDSSRVVEVNEAITFIRTMLESDAWLYNRTLGSALDVLSCVMLVLCEVYLWTVPSTRTLTSYVNSGDGVGNVTDLFTATAATMTTTTTTIVQYNPLRPHLISLCATNLLVLLIRLIVATAFGLSMHDPEVLSNARRRGLSKWDLETLPSFVFSCKEEVNNLDCCICLGNFELGEMLVSLPCDKKHSFHGGCIRQWLERQNSCPLCQKLV